MAPGRPTTPHRPTTGDPTPVPERGSIPGPLTHRARRRFLTVLAAAAALSVAAAALVLALAWPDDPPAAPPPPVAPATQAPAPTPVPRDRNAAAADAPTAPPAADTANSTDAATGIAPPSVEASAASPIDAGAPPEPGPEPLPFVPPDGPCPGPMVEIPAGAFEMGTAAGEPAEGPPHRVRLSRYCIGRTEVTVGAYALCVAEGACLPPASGDPLHNWGVAGREEHPVNGVTWDQARAYCVWAGGRLCTEAEWERAARGEDGRTYPWGNALPTCARAVMLDAAVGEASGCGGGGTAPVGSRPPGASWYGVLDLAGNAAEWVSDWYAPGYAACPGECVDPAGPATGETRLTRGGGFTARAFALRATFRNPAALGSGPARQRGIRCCADPAR